MAGLLSGSDARFSVGAKGAELSLHFQEAAVLAKKNRNPLVTG